MNNPIALLPPSWLLSVSFSLYGVFASSNKHVNMSIVSQFLVFGSCCDLALHGRTKFFSSYGKIVQLSLGKRRWRSFPFEYSLPFRHSLWSGQARSEHWWWTLWCPLLLLLETLRSLSKRDNGDDKFSRNSLLQLCQTLRAVSLLQQLHDGKLISKSSILLFILVCQDRSSCAAEFICNIDRVDLYVD